LHSTSIVLEYLPVTEEGALSEPYYAASGVDAGNFVSLALPSKRPSML